MTDLSKPTPTATRLHRVLTDDAGIVATEPICHYTVTGLPPGIRGVGWLSSQVNRLKRDCCDNAVIESFCGRAETEQLNRR